MSCTECYGGGIRQTHLWVWINTHSQELGYLGCDYHDPEKAGAATSFWAGQLPGEDGQSGLLPHLPLLTHSNSTQCSIPRPMMQLVKGQTATCNLYHGHLLLMLCWQVKIERVVKRQAKSDMSSGPAQTYLLTHPPCPILPPAPVLTAPMGLHHCLLAHWLAYTFTKCFTALLQHPSLAEHVSPVMPFSKIG